MCQETDWGFSDEHSVEEDHKEKKIHIKYGVE